MHMNTDTIEIKDGDIFRWCYRDQKPEDLGPWKRYHCKSQIAIAKDGWLVDTYWSCMSDSTKWKYAEAPAKLRLAYLGNFADLDHQQEYMAEYYDDEDCVDLNHPNSSKGNFFIRKGARRSERKMRDMIAHKIEKEESLIRVSTWRIESLRKELAKLDSGEPLDKVYL